jgi:hypothetical protein
MLYPATVQRVHSFCCYIFVCILYVSMGARSNCLYVYTEQLSSTFYISNESSLDATQNEMTLYSSSLKQYLNYTVAWWSSNHGSMYRKCYVSILELWLLIRFTALLNEQVLLN